MLSLARASMLTAPSLMRSGFAQGKKRSPEWREGEGCLGFQNRSSLPVAMNKLRVFRV